MRTLLFLLLFSPTSLLACFCGGIESFCDYTEDYFTWTPDSVVVMRGRLDDFRTPPSVGVFPLYDFEVLEVLIGDYSEPFVSLLGQDGANCNGPIPFSWRLTEGSEYIVMFSSRKAYFSAYGITDFPNPYPIHDYPGCGPATLELRGGTVSGPIKEGVSSVSLSRFLPLLEECIGVELNSPTGLAAIPFYNANVFPNPSSGLFFIEFEAPAPVLGVRIFDAHGRLISEDRLDGSPIDRHEIELDNVPPGVYQVFMETDGLTVKKRVVVI